MLCAMRRGLISTIAVLALFAVLPSCASKDGAVDSQFDANPAHAPIINQIRPMRDSAAAATAETAIGLTNVALEPIRILYDISTPGYRFGENAADLKLAMTPEERQSQRRTYMGMPQSAENRVAERRSKLRAGLGMNAQR